MYENTTNLSVNNAPTSPPQPPTLICLFSGGGRSVRCKIQAAGHKSCLQEARPPRSHAVRHQHLAHQPRPQVLGAGDQAIRQPHLAHYTRGPQDTQLVIQIALACHSFPSGHSTHEAETGNRHQIRERVRTTKAGNLEGLVTSKKPSRASESTEQPLPKESPYDHSVRQHACLHPART